MKWVGNTGMALRAQEPFRLRAFQGNRGWREWQPGSMMDGEEEEPNCLFAHGFFRRSGDAGPVTVPGGIRLLDGGLEPIPTTGMQPGPPVDAACEAEAEGMAQLFDSCF